MDWKRTLLSALLGIVCASCATHPPRGTPGALEDAQPGQRPTAASDEAGLWMYVERMEKRLSTSGRIIMDPELNAYIRGILCKLFPDYCQDIRFYIVETPHFNASMAPNGFMQIWTGLLLRAENEAQFAYILGHEFGHYVRRHSVQQWRAVRQTSDMLTFFNLATGAAGVGYVGDIAHLAALASIMAYSRDQEREADDIGFELMVEAGYDAREAARTWEALIEEREAADAPEQFIFFSTHPATEERVETLKERTSSLEVAGNTIKAQEPYLKAIRPFRAVWLRSELYKHDFAATEVLFNRLLAIDDTPGEIYFFQGELHRLRGDPGDADNALANYRRALQTADAPAETNRSMGLVLWRSGRDEDARAAFQRYLEAHEDAPDREMVESYVKDLE